jgi:hypothetical protein
VELYWLRDFHVQCLQANIFLGSTTIVLRVHLPVVSNYCSYVYCKPIPVAVRSKAWVCSRSLAGIAGSNPAGVQISVS